MKVLFAIVFAIIALSCIRTASASGVDCTVCELVVGEVEKFVSENATEAEIISKLEDACALIPDTKYAAVCKDVVRVYGPTLVKAIINQESPAATCSDIGLCNSSSIAKPIKAAQDDISCGVCTFVVGAVEKYVASNTSESDILSFLKHDCSLLGIKSWVSTCQGTVATFGPMIIQLVIAKEPADVVCTEIGLCNSTTKASAKQPTKIPITASPVKMTPTRTGAPRADNQSVGCDLCNFLVSYTEGFIAQNKTETEILSLLSTSCDALPVRDWSDTCHKMVITYGEIIIGYLLNEEPAAVVCTEVGLCSASKQKSM